MARVARAGRFFGFGLAIYLLSYLYIYDIGVCDSTTCSNKGTGAEFLTGSASAFLVTSSGCFRLVFAHSCRPQPALPTLGLCFASCLLPPDPDLVVPLLVLRVFTPCVHTWGPLYGVAGSVSIKIFPSAIYLLSYCNMYPRTLPRVNTLL